MASEWTLVFFWSFFHPEDALCPDPKACTGLGRTGERLMDTKQCWAGAGQADALEQAEELLKNLPYEWDIANWIITGNSGQGSGSDLLCRETG